MPNPGKGDRIALTTRVHPDISRVIRVGAAEAGVPVTDYLADILAAYVQRPELSPMGDHSKSQERLPMTG